MLDALRISQYYKIPLPKWAHEILGHAALQYWMSDGNTSFDEILGLKAGKGRDNSPLKKRRNHEFRVEVAYRVAEANKRYGFTLPVVYWLLSSVGVDDQYLSPSRIEEIYKDEEKATHHEGDAFLFRTCSDRGYFDAIFNGEKELRELGLYASAINTVEKMLKRGE